MILALEMEMVQHADFTGFYKDYLQPKRPILTTWCGLHSGKDESVFFSNSKYVMLSRSNSNRSYEAVASCVALGVFLRSMRPGTTPC
jgi:hypothetical protein